MQYLEFRTKQLEDDVKNSKRILLIQVEVLVSITPSSVALEKINQREKQL